MSGVIFPGDDPDNLMAKLEALARDIGRIRSGDYPSRAELEAAPVLHAWGPAARLTTCLVGSVRGHPILHGHREITTSELYAIDPLRSWARTYSRLYILGARFDEQDVRHG